MDLNHRPLMLVASPTITLTNLFFIGFYLPFNVSLSSTEAKVV